MTKFFFLQDTHGYLNTSPLTQKAADYILNRKYEE
jgi:hypothetical protein